MAATSAPSPFLSDAGPAFDPDGAHAAPTAPPPRRIDGAPVQPGLVVPDWDPELVKTILRAKGAALHAVVGVAERDWAYTEQDLAAIAPPLTRILNRYDVTRAAAGTGDEIALVIGVGGYTMRSIQERRAALAAVEEQRPPEPVSGVAAEPGTGPPAVATFDAADIAAAATAPPPQSEPAAPAVTTEPPEGARWTRATQP